MPFQRPVMKMLRSFLRLPGVNMELKEPIVERVVTELDFMFAAGGKLSLTVDEGAGDSVQELADRYIVTIAPKPSLSDPEETIEGETLEVFKKQLAAVSRCQRVQRQPTEEEKLQRLAIMKSLTSLVQ